MQKTAYIHSKADQEYLLYDWRERYPCEVAIQAASAGRGGPPRGAVMPVPGTAESGPDCAGEGRF